MCDRDCLPVLGLPQGSVHDSGTFSEIINFSLLQRPALLVQEPCLFSLHSSPSLLTESPLFSSPFHCRRASGENMERRLRGGLAELDGGPLVNSTSVFLHLEQGLRKNPEGGPSFVCTSQRTTSHTWCQSTISFSNRTEAICN